MRIKLDHADPLSGLAWLLATPGHAEDADSVRVVALAQQAYKLTDNRAAADFDAPAAAYAAAGRFSDAMATAQKAVELARAGEQWQWSRGLRADCNCIATDTDTNSASTRQIRKPVTLVTGEES